MHPQDGARGFSFQLDEGSPKPPELGRLDLDWSDLASPASGPSADGTPLMPHAAAGRRPEPRSLLAAFAPDAAPIEPSASAPAVARQASASGAAQASAPAPSPNPTLDASAAPHPQRPTAPTADGSPVVRRLRFPASSAAPSASTAPAHTEPVPAVRKPSPRPSTRFADSIGRSRPLADSIDGPLDDAPPPEDLPDFAGSAAALTADAAPAPAELLRRASTLWSSATKTATNLGGRGLESGRLLAGQMSDALRERFEQTLEQRHRADAPTDAAAPLVDQGAGATLHMPPERRKLSLTLSRKSAGPVLALVAALGMFIASRQLLGVGGVGLSKTAPAIPDLGESPESKTPAQAMSSPAAAAPTAAAKSGPPPMETEVVPLPAGLAWPGKGLLEVVTSEDELVYVDGVFTGRGPLRRVPVAPGEHEVSIRKEGSERRGAATVELGRTTRAVFRGK